MKPLTAAKLMKILKAHGFQLARQKGSHTIWKNSNGIIVPVPLHGKNKPIHLGTLLAIIKQSKIPKDKFR
ncbi:MAG: type II toxin-antitoxin system HicA family toxin [Patescibacteria group bacterium]